MCSCVTYPRQFNAALAFGHLTPHAPHIVCHHCGVLVCADEDFLEPVQAALANGFDVTLVSHDTGSNVMLAQAYARPPLLWSRFLRQVSGEQQVVLPYGGEADDDDECGWCVCAQCAASPIRHLPRMHAMVGVLGLAVCMTGA